METLPIGTWSRARRPGPGLGWALAVSLGLHLLLLWPSPPEGRVAVIASQLRAELRPADPGVNPPRSASIEHTPRPTLAAAERQAPRAPREGRVADIQSNHRPPESEAGTDGAGIRSALPEMAGLDADALRGFRVALAREARRYKHYPAQAVEAGWQGTVELEATIRMGGGDGVRLVRSSGHALLDGAALDMMNKALAATAVPATLREQDFLISLPVMFELPQ